MAFTRWNLVLYLFIKIIANVNMMTKITLKEKKYKVILYWIFFSLSQNKPLNIAEKPGVHETEIELHRIIYDRMFLVFPCYKVVALYPEWYISCYLYCFLQANYILIIMNLHQMYQYIQTIII